MTIVNIFCLLNVFWGVRKNTSINLCFVESVIPPPQFVIAKKSKTFLQKKLRVPDLDEPFHYVYDLCRRNNTPGFRFLNNARDVDVSHDPLESIRNDIRAKPETATKYVTYRDKLNPDLSVHKIYSTSEYIPELYPRFIYFHVYD